MSLNKRHYKKIRADVIEANSITARRVTLADSQGRPRIALGFGQTETGQTEDAPALVLMDERGMPRLGFGFDGPSDSPSIHFFDAQGRTRTLLKWTEQSNGLLSWYAPDGQPIGALCLDDDNVPALWQNRPELNELNEATADNTDSIDLKDVK